MRQRLALARTMIVEPELLLLDEPFGALDERTRESMQQLLVRAVRETGCSVIFVTHDVRVAIRFISDCRYLNPAAANAGAQHDGTILLKPLGLGCSSFAHSVLTSVPLPWMSSGLPTSPSRAKSTKVI
jgi:ABC-type proline/glycine betaine transport system ATPase subunit